jgi:hypothetical protein
MSPSPIKTRRRRRKKLFRFDHIRRREIERLARHLDAANTEDLTQYLIVWARHNRQSNDPIWAIRNAALRMGRQGMSDSEASAISQEAAAFHKAMSADDVALELGVTWAQRQALSLTTIGAVNMSKEARKEIRRIRDKVAKEKKRRAAGVQPRAKYESYSLSATQPWKGENMSRAAWYKARRKNETSVSTALLTSAAENKTSETSPSTALLLTTGVDTPVSTGVATSSFNLETACSDSPVAVDIHVSMSPEARYLALGIKPQAQVVTAADPRMVAKMAGGYR